MTIDPPTVHVTRFESIDSTSLHARRLVLGPDSPRAPFLLVAAEQTGGVGQFGRRWYSPRGGLWFTLATPLPVNATARAAVLDGLGLRVGVACLRGLRDVLRGHVPGDTIRLKWPNDLLIGGRKVLGVLTEVIPQADAHWVLIGVGVNVNVDIAGLPGEIAARSTSVHSHTGSDVELARVEQALLGPLLGASTGGHTGSGGVDADTLDTARAALAVEGVEAEATLPDGSKVRGQPVGLDDAGRLLVRTPSGAIVRA